MHEEVTFWEKVAKTEWGSYVTEIERQAILKANHLAGKPTLALEIGCEGGRWSMLLTQLRWNMICTDIDPKSLDVCQKRIPMANCILVNPNDTRLPCETTSLGLLVCIEVDPVISAEWFIQEASRVLRSGGIIVGVVFNSFSPRAVVKQSMDKIDSMQRREGTSPYKLSYRKLKQRLVQNGFNIAYEEGFCWFPFRRNSNSFMIPLLTQIERVMGLRQLTMISPWIAFIAQKR